MYDLDGNIHSEVHCYEVPLGFFPEGYVAFEHLSVILNAVCTTNSILFAFSVLEQRHTDGYSKTTTHKNKMTCMDRYHKRTVKLPYKSLNLKYTCVGNTQNYN